MRFLKTKILMARQALDRKLSNSPAETPLVDSEFQFQNIESSASLKISSQPAAAKKQKVKRRKQNRLRKHKKEQKPLTGNLRATKNIVINFGKAIAAFANSDLAEPYLAELVVKEGVTLQDFKAFSADAKAKIGGIDSFRAFLLANEKDDATAIACKKVFTGIAEIFVKYFSVNWITHGRVTHKLTYLKYRFKILRRIQNPHLFTYISEGRRKN